MSPATDAEPTVNDDTPESCAVKSDRPAADDLPPNRAKTPKKPRALPRPGDAVRPHRRCCIGDTGGMVRFSDVPIAAGAGAAEPCHRGRRRAAVLPARHHTEGPRCRAPHADRLFPGRLDAPDYDVVIPGPREQQISCHRPGRHVDVGGRRPTPHPAFGHPLQNRRTLADLAIRPHLRPRRCTDDR
jgi:hypothetical protein